MRSMLAVLLLAMAAVAQPEPLLGGLTVNLLGGQAGLVGGLLGGSGGGGLLEGLLGGDGLVGGLVSGLLGPLLGGGGGGLLGGLLGGAGGGVDGAVGQVGDLVTCVLGQVLGQVGGLLDQILGLVPGALGLQGSTNPPRTFLEKLIDEIRQEKANLTDVIKAFEDGKIDIDDIETLIVRDVINTEEIKELLEVANVISQDTFFDFMRSGVIDAENIADMMLSGEFDNEGLQLLVKQNIISAEVAEEVLALVES